MTNSCDFYLINLKLKVNGNALMSKFIRFVITFYINILNGKRVTIFMIYLKYLWTQTLNNLEVQVNFSAFLKIFFFF